MRSLGPWGSCSSSSVSWSSSACCSAPRVSSESRRDARAGRDRLPGGRAGTGGGGPGPQLRLRPRAGQPRRRRRTEPISLWTSDGRPHTGLALEAIARRPIPLRYPLIEAEVAERTEAKLVTLAESGPRALLELATWLGWESYVIAPIVLERKTAGLLHADRTPPGDPVDELDLELAILYADGLGRAFERAVLRDKLRRQRRQLQLAGQWVNGQILRLSAEGSAPRRPS